MSDSLPSVPAYVTARVNLAPKLPANYHPPLSTLFAHPCTIELLLAPCALVSLLGLCLDPPPLRVELGRPVHEHRGDLGDQSIRRAGTPGACARSHLYIPSNAQVVLQVFAFCFDPHRRLCLSQHTPEALGLVFGHVPRVDT